APASAPPIVLAPAAAPMPAPAVRQETPALPASVAVPPPASPAPAPAASVAIVPAAPAPAAVKQASAATTPAPVAAPQPITLEDGLAHFDFDRAELSAQGRAELDAWLQQPLPKGTILRVTGHADRLGPAAYNLKLSGRRAETVKKYMVEKGVAAAGVEVIAKGESEPVKHCKGGASKATIACLAPNRRVEIKP
ncbi:MAG: OmpA-OmpF porin OOP family, partial [bacterium]